MAGTASVMAELKAKASETIRAIYIRHGHLPQRTLGVKSADMKAIAKTIKKQQALACELYATGTLEAMYLAGMVADGAQLTKKQLQQWADGAAGMPMVYEYTVPWVALESADPRALAMEWIASRKEHVAAAGWCTYSGIVATVADEKLDLKEIEALLKSIPEKVTAAPNRVRSKMNSFVIAVGTYVAPLLKQAVATAKQIGVVPVDVGDTDCEIPVASERIAKAQASGRAGVKRTTIRC
jgi:3-methyladenine DNA glycosylase AlkD